MSTPARMSWTAVDNVNIKEHNECKQLKPLTTVSELNSIEPTEYVQLEPITTDSKHNSIELTKCTQHTCTTNKKQ